MSFFGFGQITVEQAHNEIYKKVIELAPRVKGYEQKGDIDNFTWLANKIGLTLNDPPRERSISPAQSSRPAQLTGASQTTSGGRRRKARKTRRLRR